jgi:hypothetical protein
MRIRGRREGVDGPLRQRWRRLARAATHITPVAILVFLAVEWNGIPGQDRDTIAYHHAAASARADGAIYERKPPPGPHELTDWRLYLYPPPLAALLSFLPETTYRTFDRGWLVLNLLAFWILAAALGRLAAGAWSVSSTARWGAAAFFFPGTLLAIHYGNMEVILLALVAVGLALPATAGLTVGLAAAFKVTPVWPLLTLAARRPRRALPGLAAAVALCGGACLWVFGARGTVDLVVQWITDIMPTVVQGQFWGESFSNLQAGQLRFVDFLGNLSVSFAPVQIAALSGWWDYDGGPLPGSVRGYLTAVAIGVPLVAAWLTRRRSPNVQAAVVLAAALFAAPIVRPYALPVLLLVLATVRQERRDAGDLPPAPGRHRLAAQIERV